MKPLYNNILSIIVTSTAIFTSLNINAQEKENDFLLHQLYYRNCVTDYKSKISSDIVFAPKEQNTLLSLSYNGEYGDFALTQNARNLTLYNVSVEGVNLSFKDVYMAGGVNFSEQYKQNVRFTSIINPFRGNPYQLADSTASDWKTQYYSMWTKLAKEIIDNRLAMGVYLSLDVARGAKDIDPRPKSNNCNIIAIPSLTFNMSNHRFGGAFIYNRFNENTNIILYNTSEPQLIYSFKGLGQNTYDIFTNTERERKYDGYGVGAMVSYRYIDDSFEMNLRGEYDNYGETTSDIENNKPRLCGKYYSDKYKAFASLQYSTNSFTNQLKFFFDYRDDSGKEIIQIYNSDAGVNAWQTDSEAPKRWILDDKDFSASYLLKALDINKRYSLCGVEFSYCKRVYDESYKAMDSYIKYNNDLIGISPEINRIINKKMSLSLRLNGEYCFVSKVESNYKRRNDKDNSIDLLYMDRDMELLKQNYYMVGGELITAYSVDSSHVFSLSVDYKYLRSDNGLYRHYPKVTLSYHF